ncbi:hypothetical protein N9U47_01880 [Candidatus Pelagibacter sp.]|nr:hypothetical protein [Candidatus Pelagibacter sp.]
MTINKKNNSKILYIFFIILSLNIFFFSTEKIEAKSFDVENIDISRAFEINFNKNEVIDEGFEKAFFELISIIVTSSDKEKINKIKLNEIKGMIESFSIKEEKFINEIYYVNLGVSFNKKRIFSYLEQKNIFPSIPIVKKFLFIPIIIDEKSNDLLIFENNKVFDKWNQDLSNKYLIEYILPTEDLEDLNRIKKNYENIEKYDFKEITSKYNLNHSIIALIFKNEKELRVLSRISNGKNVVLKNKSYNNKDLFDEAHITEFIDDLKLTYDDYWKKVNQINTSIKFPLNIKIDNNNKNKILDFEKNLGDIDLIYDFYITKFDKNHTYYQIIFNGAPNIFLKTMKEKNYNFDTQNKIWYLE